MTEHPLTVLVTRFEEAVRNNFSEDDVRDAMQDALVEGIEYIDHIHAVLVENAQSLGSLGDLETRVRGILGDLAGDLPAAELGAQIAKTSEAVRNYTNGFLAHDKVGICPKQIPPAKRRIEELTESQYIAKTPHHNAESVMTEHQLLQTTIIDRIGAVNMQLIRIREVFSQLSALQNSTGPLGSFSHYLSFRLQPDTEPLPSIQSKIANIHANILNMALNFIEERRFHKDQDRSAPLSKNEYSQIMVVHQVRTDAGHFTGYYERFTNLGDFVCQLMAHHPGIQELVVGRETDDIDWLVSSLAKTRDARFPIHVTDPFLYAFKNGHFNIRTLKFKPFVAENQDKFMRVDETNATDAQLEELDTYAKECNNAVDQIKDDDLLKSLQESGKNPCMYIPQDFCVEDLWQTLPNLESKCTSLVRILEYQGFNFDVRRIIYVMNGRALYPLPKRKDRWTFSPYFVGKAGSGKSTIIDAVCACLPEGSTGAIEAEFEETFGWWALMKKRLAVAVEYPKNIPLTTLCKAISGEEVGVARKGGMAMTINWPVPIMFAANRFFDSNNEEGQITRRMIVVNFCKMVTKSDPTIRSDMFKQIGSILVLFARCYDEFAAAHGNQDFIEATRLTTPYFTDQQNLRYISSNPLAAALTNPSCFVPTPPNATQPYYISWENLGVQLGQYSATFNSKKIDMSAVDAVTAVVERLGFKVENGMRRDYTNNNIMRHGRWLVGCIHVDLVNQFDIMAADVPASASQF